MDTSLHFKRLFLAQSYFSVIVIHVQLCKHSWYKKPQKRRLVASIQQMHSFNKLKYLTALPQEKAYLKELNIAHLILSKNELTNSYVTCVSSDQVL